MPCNNIKTVTNRDTEVISTALVTNSHQERLTKLPLNSLRVITPISGDSNCKEPDQKFRIVFEAGSQVKETPKKLEL